MSVMTLGLEVYKEVFKKACSYRYQSVVDINYSNVLKINEGHLRLWVYRLYEMVHVSYCVRYRKEVSETELQMVRKDIESWRYNFLMGPNCNTYQMLKHLRCIHYQIEDCEMKIDGVWKLEYDAAWNMLNNAINELKNRIIDEIPEYKEAKWGKV